MKWLRKAWNRLMGNKVGDVTHPPVKVLDISPQAKMDWGLTTFGIPALWSMTKGAGVKVGIVDTGACLQHPDLKDAIVASKDFTGKGTAEDGDGHGTHVAGIIGARGNSAGATAGVAPECQLYIAKALGDDGSGDFGNIEDAIEWLIAQKVDIINMSLGGSDEGSGLHDVIKKAAQQGIILICAAGNDGVDAIDDVDYPGKYDECIAVGALNPNLSLAAYSSVGPEVDILAPGTQVYSTYLNNSYALLSGTSMATPFISGVAAMAVAKARLDGKPITSGQQLNALLKKDALSRPDLLQTTKGYGIVDPAEVFKDL